MNGPYRELHIYEVEGHVANIPSKWSSLGFLGCWHEGGYSFLFFSTARKEVVERFLAQHHTGRIRDISAIPYEDWEAGEPLKPFRVGPLLVAPPWERVEPKAGEQLLILDSGVSFGSGHHASTRTCLELLVGLYEQACPRSVLDLGTGSGILAMAAARLGAEHVLAVDVQPLAVETARANVRVNRLGGRVEVRLGDAMQFVEEPAELMMANLTYEVLVELLSRPGLYEKSWYILSGVVGTQIHGLKERLALTQLRVKRVRSENFWFSILLAREP